MVVVFCLAADVARCEIAEAERKANESENIDSRIGLYSQRKYNDYATGPIGGNRAFYLTTSGMFECNLNYNCPLYVFFFLTNFDVIIFSLGSFVPTYGPSYGSSYGPNYGQAYNVPQDMMYVAPYGNYMPPVNYGNQAPNYGSYPVSYQASYTASNAYAAPSMLAAPVVNASYANPSQQFLPYSGNAAPYGGYGNVGPYANSYASQSSQTPYSGYSSFPSYGPPTYQTGNYNPSYQPSYGDLGNSYQYFQNNNQRVDSYVGGLGTSYNPYMSNFAGYGVMSTSYM